MTMTETFHKSNDRLSFVRNLASNAATNLNKAESIARKARQQLAFAAMSAIAASLVRIDVGNGDVQQWRLFDGASAVRAALKLYPACEAPDNFNGADMSEEECRDWQKAIAELLFPAPAWMPESGFKKAEATAAQLHEIDKLDKARGAAKRAAKLAFLLIARGVVLQHYDDDRGFAVNRDHFFPTAIKHKGTLITQYDVINAGEPVFMTPGKFGMVKIAARLNLGSDGSHDHVINATVENLEKAASLIKSRNESDDLAAALKLVKDLAIDRKFTVIQRELVNAAIVKLTAIKAAWDSVDNETKAASQRNDKKVA